MARKSVQIVPLAESHLPEILLIEKQTNSAPWSEVSFRNELDHPYGVFRVALASGKVVGYGGVWLVIDEIHITTIAVDPAQQRQGIGRRLMEVLLEEGEKRGGTCSTLEVRAGNAAAIGLYEGLGFVRAALRKRYYPDNKEDAVVMWRYDLADSGIASASR